MIFRRAKKRNASIKLHLAAYNHASKLIMEKNVERDERHDWSNHQPAENDKNQYIQEHGYKEYGKWFLGIDESKNETTKSRYKFPYGDFKKVHRCAVISAEIRVKQHKYDDIEQAAAHLHNMIDMELKK